MLALDGGGKFPDSVIPDTVLRTSGGTVTGDLVVKSLAAINEPTECTDVDAGQLCADRIARLHGGLDVDGQLSLDGDLELRGNLRQSSGNFGTVKAGARIVCGTGSAIFERFTNVSGAPDMAITSGATSGKCKVDFGFPVEFRFIGATAFRRGARTVTVTERSGNAVEFQIWDETGAGQNGTILVLVY